MRTKLLVGLNSLLVVVLVIILFRPHGPIGNELQRWKHERDVTHEVEGAWTVIAGPSLRLNSAQTRQPTLVVFSDYECPFCRQLEASLTELVATDTNVIVAFRQLPLSSHEHAEVAARASLCATAQGHFPEMHKLLFAEEQWRNDGNVLALVHDAGVPDSSAFRACLGSESVRAIVATDVALARRLEITGTPAIVTRHGLRQGALSTAELREFVGP